MAKRCVCYKDNEFEISYIFLNHHCNKNILFLHGWGSNKELMQLAFKESFKDYNHYYIDMPGFGNSPNSVVISTHDYAQIIKKFSDYFGKMDIVIGHSFGGKVALLCDSDEIILLSSAGIPVPKSLKVKSKILLAKILKTFKIKSTKLRSPDADKLNEAMYAVFKQVVNEDFSNIYAHFSKKAYVFWGADDRATPLWCGEKISTLIPDNRFFVLQGDHYFFLKQAKIIDEKYHQAKDTQSNTQGRTMKETIKITIKGIVQQVGFRKFSKAKADELNIKGTAQNKPDGSVEIIACGVKNDIDKFISVLKIGPSKSKVESVEFDKIGEFASDVFEIIQ